MSPYLHPRSVRTITFRVFPSLTRVPSHCVLRPLRFRISLRAPSYFYPRDMPSLTKKRTAAKKQQQQQQPPLPSTETVPPPLNNSIDFEVFITLADVDNIIQFCDAAAST